MNSKRAKTLRKANPERPNPGRKHGGENAEDHVSQPAARTKSATTPGTAAGLLSRKRNVLVATVNARMQRAGRSGNPAKAAEQRAKFVENWKASQS